MIKDNDIMAEQSPTFAYKYACIAEYDGVTNLITINRIYQYHRRYELGNSE